MQTKRLIGEYVGARGYSAVIKLALPETGHNEEFILPMPAIERSISEKERERDISVRTDQLGGKQRGAIIKKINHCGSLLIIFL